MIFGISNILISILNGSASNVKDVLLFTTMKMT